MRKRMLSAFGCMPGMQVHNPANSTQDMNEQSRKSCTHTWISPESCALIKRSILIHSLRTKSALWGLTGIKKQTLITEVALPLFTGIKSWGVKTLTYSYHDWALACWHICCTIPASEQGMWTKIHTHIHNRHVFSEALWTWCESGQMCWQGPCI